MYRGRWKILFDEDIKEPENKNGLVSMAVIIALAVGLLGYGASKLNYEDSNNLPVPTPAFSTPEGQE